MEEGITRERGGRDADLALLRRKSWFCPDHISFLLHDVSSQVGVNIVTLFTIPKLP